MAGFVPAPVTPKVTPGQVVASKPDKDGIVTMLRPIVTRLHPDDPVRIALHWATEKGPLSERDFGTRTLQRSASLRSMTFVLTPPDGKKQELKADVQPRADEWVPGLHYAPTYLLGGQVASAHARNLPTSVTKSATAARLRGRTIDNLIGADHNNQHPIRISRCRSQ